MHQTLLVPDKFTRKAAILYYSFILTATSTGLLCSEITNHNFPELSHPGIHCAMSALRDKLHISLITIIIIIIITTCSKVVLQCYRWQAILVEQGKIRPSVTLYIITKLGIADYVGDPYLDANFSQIWLSGEVPANRWLFVVSLFPWACLEKNPWTDLHT